jgi:hypothetical protein
MTTEVFAHKVEFYAQSLHYQYNFGPGTGLTGILEPRWLELSNGERNKWRRQARDLLLQSEKFIQDSM